VAVCNPPYRKRGSGRVNNHDESQIARHELTGDIGDFLGAGAFFLGNKGRMALVYPAVRCADLICAMRQARVEPKRLRMVHSFSHSVASLVLVEGVKGGRAGLVVESPMTIYRQDKHYTDELAKIVAGAQR
jgi:tRNA1Val (adenine37-N6)-methyltransferase